MQAYIDFAKTWKTSETKIQITQRYDLSRVVPWGRACPEHFENVVVFEIYKLLGVPTALVHQIRSFFEHYLRIILSNFVATDVYALFMKSIKKNLLRNVQNEGGGGPTF